MDTREGCPITPGSSLTKVFSLTPSVNGAKDVRGVALDGFLKVDSRLLHIYVFTFHNLTVHHVYLNLG